MKTRTIISLAALVSIVGACGSAIATSSQGETLLDSGQFTSQIYKLAGEKSLDLSTPETSFRICLPTRTGGKHVKAYFDLNLTTKNNQFPDRNILQLNWTATKANGQEVSMTNFVSSGEMPSAPGWFAAESRTLNIPTDAVNICFKIDAELFTEELEVTKGLLKNLQIHVDNRD